MKTSIGLALLAGFAALPALADAPPPSRRGTGAAPAHHGPQAGWSGARRHRHHHGVRVRGYAAVSAGPVYGPEPHYYPGAGGASPNAGFGAVRAVAVVGYREAYIGRGLVYNTPPEPHWAVWSHRSDVISVKY